MSKDKAIQEVMQFYNVSKEDCIDYYMDEVEAYMKLEPEQGITPDNWVIIEVNHEGEQFQKILAGWGGSYLYGDSWRMSSPIKEMNINIEKDYIVVETDSGSVYNLHKDRQELRMSNAGIYNELKEKFGDSVEIVEL
jgi:hypothetical protein